MAEIKLCGLFRPCDIEYVNQARPDYCGFILNFPKSHRNLTLEQATDLSQRLASDITPVGVFVDRSLEEVAGALESGFIRIAQLHGHEEEGYIRALQARTGKPVWKAFRVRCEADVAAALASPADRILLDNGAGTGQTFDWTLLRRIDRPWILAGGLTPGNLRRAIEQLHPTGVDLSSGVETNRVKDLNKMRLAVQQARITTGKE